MSVSRGLERAGWTGWGLNRFLRPVRALTPSRLPLSPDVPLVAQGYETQKFVFQGVHETICYGPCDQSWKEDEPRMNQIVFIGRGLDRKALIEGLRTCVWVPLPDGWQEFRDPVSKRIFYSNKTTGEKSWSRPESLACAHVVASQGSTEQPINRRPRMSAPS
jgi:hypothetical protein